MDVRKLRGSARVRVQLDLPPREVAALDALRDRLQLRSRADAVRTALGVLEWVQREAALGRRVLAVGKDDVVHLALPRGLGE